jgi:hypothetical protein
MRRRAAVARDASDASRADRSAARDAAVDASDAALRTAARRRRVDAFVVAMAAIESC